MIFILFKEHKQGNGSCASDQSMFCSIYSQKREIQTKNAIQNEFIVERKNTQLSKIDQRNKEKIFTLQYDMCNKVNDDDSADDDSDKDEDLLSGYTDASSVSSISYGTAVSDSSALMIQALPFQCYNDNIVDRIPHDMLHGKKRVFASLSMILRFLEIRQERMGNSRNPYVKNDELNDLFRWAASKYPREDTSYRTFAGEMLPVTYEFSLSHPIDTWMLNNLEKKSKFHTRLYI
jgi:hypothetical protein